MKTIQIKSIAIILLYLAGITPVSAQTIFEDDFSSLDLSGSQNGFTWGSSTGTTVVPNSPNGTAALQFTFNGNTDINADAWSEQRYELGNQYSEIWMKYDLYIPTNYKHRYRTQLVIDNIVGTFSIGDIIEVSGNSTKSATIHSINGDTLTVEYHSVRFAFGNNPAIINVTSGATANVTQRIGFGDNNKGISFMWQGQYGTGNTGQALNTANWSDLNDGSIISYQIIVDTDNLGHTGTGVKSVDPNTDLGQWIEWIVRYKVAGPTNDNGILQMWKNGVLVVDVDSIPNYSSLGNNYYERGYLMGWANSGFDETTIFYIDNIVFSENPILPVTTDLIFSNGFDNNFD